MEQQTKRYEDALNELISMVCRYSQQESEAINYKMQQINTLVGDAVTKINGNLTLLPEKQTEMPNADQNLMENLLCLLNRAATITNEINCKINGMIQAVQVEDIVNQLIGEIQNRLDRRNRFFVELQHIMAHLAQRPIDAKLATFDELTQQLEVMYQDTPRNAVSQTNMDDGNVELF